MKTAKQIAVLRAIGNKYKVDVESGIVYRYRKNTSEYRPICVNKLPNGYLQVSLFAGRGLGKGIVTYAHHVVWLYANGEFDEQLQINHINGLRQDNRLDNLELVTPKENIAHSLKFKPRNYSPYANKTIRNQEIKEIRLLHSLGHSQSAIARSLGLGRLSVRYIIKRIESGEPLKFEHID